VESTHYAELAGFKAIKVKVGGGDWKLNVARVVAISAATPGLSIIVDGNAGFSRSQAHRFLGGVTGQAPQLSLLSNRSRLLTSLSCRAASPLTCQPT
jgi:L-alanine-DL-glutamate epimerase-like enolase superfamily enzyme